LATDARRLISGIGLITGSRAAAEDAVAEALARAWERSERGEQIESLKAWVTTVAMNLTRSGLRRLRVERGFRDRMSSLPAGKGTASGVADRLDIRRALAALPRRQREATVLRYYLGLDVAEIAGVLEVSEGTAKTALFRARRALAEALGEQDLEEATDSGR
jgi:RNA polymerase sigma-70 factor, ECF subfamily